MPNYIYLSMSAPLRNLDIKLHYYYFELNITNRPINTQFYFVIGQRERVSCNQWETLNNLHCAQYLFKQGQKERICSSFPLWGNLEAAEA